MFSFVLDQNGDDPLKRANRYLLGNVSHTPALYVFGLPNIGPPLLHLLLL